jgi:phosphoserine phosphatase
MNSPLKAALVYDFDGTLARGNMQEHSFIPSLKREVGEFWAETKRFAEKHDADEVLTYMRLMLQESEALGQPITRSSLREHGSQVPLFEGVREWFGHINEFARSLEMQLDHYVISSGLYEMIEGCPIFSEFKQVYASRYLYNEAGQANWPAVAVNYTTKTQFLFRINKGIESTWDNRRINEWVNPESRPLPFQNMIFIGDGETDVPAMKMVRYQGGYAVAVFDPEKFARNQTTIHKLISADRCNYVAPADYRKASQLDVTLCGILQRIAERRSNL